MNTVMFMPMNGRRLFRRWTERVLAGDFGERDVCLAAEGQDGHQDKGDFLLKLFKIFMSDNKQRHPPQQFSKTNLYRKLQQGFASFVSK